jgi:hypothetical protein
MEKYIGKYRLIIIETPDKNNNMYKKAIEQYEKYKRDFDILSTIVKSKVIEKSKFTIKLYGIDGTLKYKTNTFKNWNEFINLIKEMPMQKNVSKLTLFSDYHPEMSKKNLGYKNKEVALNTIKLIKDKPLRYQFLIINTMYYRAKYHYKQTKEMREAMKIFKKWLDEYKKID